MVRLMPRVFTDITWCHRFLASQCRICEKIGSWFWSCWWSFWIFRRLFPSPLMLQSACNVLEPQSRIVGTKNHLTRPNPTAHVWDGLVSQWFPGQNLCFFFGSQSIRFPTKCQGGSEINDTTASSIVVFGEVLRKLQRGWWKVLSVHGNFNMNMHKELQWPYMTQRIIFWMPPLHEMASNAFDKMPDIQHDIIRCCWLIWVLLVGSPLKIIVPLFNTGWTHTPYES